MRSGSGDQLRVGVFRLQLFKRSETFIPAQVGRYRRYRPIYIGRKLFGEAPHGAEVVTPATDPLTAARLLALGDAGPFVQALGDRRIDVLHAHFAIDAVFALPLARRLGVPLVTTLHGFDVTTTDQAMLRSGRPALIASVLRRRALQRDGAQFLCVSEFIRRAALARDYPAERSIVHAIGVDLERLRPSSDSQPGLIVHVARLVEKKGTTFLLQALARLAGSRPDVQLVVVGEGPLRPALEAEAGRLGLGEKARFLGAQTHEETLNWMRRASLIAVPSVTAASGDSEGLPTVVFEAGGLAVPVVASDTSGIPEAVKDGETGLLAPPGDVEALADRLERILSDQGLRDTLGRQARALMETRFDLARQTFLLEECYDQIRGAEPRVPR
jgi:glycosyltransferase involved in cell wall biosynthesis